jgi:hypothetical protein
MNRLLLISIFCISVLAFSKEGTAGAQDQLTTKLIKKITSVYKNEKPEVEEYFYDASRRLIKNQDADNITTYEYLPNLIKGTRINRTSNEIQTINEINLDKNGRAMMVNTKNKEGKIIAYTEYLYDVNGFATKVVNGYPNQTPSHREFTIQNDNYVQGKRFSGNKHTRNFQYSYENIKNKMPYSVFSMFPSASIFGKPSKNLVKEYKETDLNGKIEYHNTVTYEYDKDNYPIKIITTNMLTGDKSIDSYVFE